MKSGCVSLVAFLLPVIAEGQQFLKVYQDPSNRPQFGFVHEPTSDGGFILSA